jgi:hypothetical protein
MVYYSQYKDMIIRYDNVIIYNNLNTNFLTKAFHLWDKNVNYLHDLSTLHKQMQERAVKSYVRSSLSTGYKRRTKYATNRTSKLRELWSLISKSHSNKRH